MLCKGCGMNRAGVSSQFCSQVCEERWNEGKVIRECKKCGRVFERPIEKHTLVCPDCYYREHYAPPKSPARRAGKTPPKDEIGEIIHQQQKLQAETGRRLSYGEIVAKMDEV